MLAECVGDRVAKGEGGEGAAGGEERPSAGPPDGSRDGLLGHGPKQRITGLVAVHGGSNSKSKLLPSLLEWLDRKSVG